MSLFDSPVWVHGAQSLAARVACELRQGRRRVRLVSADQVARQGPGRCRLLILADPENPTQLLASIIERLGSGRRIEPLRLILMHSAPLDAQLATTLADLASPALVRLETFAVEDRAARAILDRWPLHFGLDPRFGQTPHLLLVGFAPPARALLVQALRLIHYSEERPRVTVVCDVPPVCSQTFTRAYPQADQVARIDWVGPEQLDLGTMPAVTQVLVCLEPAELGLDRARETALEIARSQGRAPPIVLEIGAAEPRGDAQDWDGQIFPVSYLQEACRPQVLLGGQGDHLAQTVHAHYMDTIAAQGRDPAAEAAGQPWDRLATSYRDANRHQADHLGAKLALVDCRAVPEDWVDAFSFNPLETERLAIVEHLRWSADRCLDGWSYAAERDNARKHHPLLVPYAQLSGPMKDLDRFAVRGVPALLARSEMGVVRMLILGLPDPGPDGPRGATRPGLVDRVLARLLARYPDRALVIASTLSDPWARLVARRALDTAEAGLFLLCARPIAQTLADQADPGARRDLLELAARAERRISLAGPGELKRWLSERAEIVLTLGDQTDDVQVAKRVSIDPLRRRLQWGFDY